MTVLIYTDYFQKKLNFLTSPYLSLFWGINLFPIIKLSRKELFNSKEAKIGMRLVRITNFVLMFREKGL
jgi:hypothetical protein